MPPTSPDAPMKDTITMGLQEALRMENSSVEKLNMMIADAVDPKMRQKLQHHLDETNEQIQRITSRLQQLGIPATAEKASAPPIILEPGTPTLSSQEKLMAEVKNGYAWENFEIAHYEFLKHQADNVDDKDTKKVAEHNQKEEKDFADDIEHLIPELVNNGLAGPAKS